MSLEAYSIAVRISLVEGVTRGLALMSRHFKETNAEAAALQARLSSIGKMAAVGGALLGAGFLGLASLKGPLEEAKLYQVELGRFASLGFGSKINAQADSYAQGMRTIGTSTRDNLTLVSDAMAVFKNLDDAKMAAPILARMKFGNEVMFGGERGKANEGKFMDLLKVIEFRGGLSSPAEFERQANYAQKVISGSRGRVDATAMLQALKTGGVALSRRANEQFYLGGEPLIQEFGGSRYGTAAMSIYQNLVQSRGTETAQAELFRLGLLDPSKVEFNKLGKLKKALPGAFKGSSILENQGELALLQQVLLPAFASKGITDPEAVTRELGMILGNRTGSSLMSRIYQQQGILQKQSTANRNAYGINQLAGAAAKSAAGQELDLEKKEADLKLKIGQLILPLYVQGLQLAASVLTKINAMPPIFLKIGVYGLVLISTLSILSGSLLLITSGVRLLSMAFSISRIPGALSAIATGIRFASPFLLSFARLVGAGLVASLEGVVLAATEFAAGVRALGLALIANPLGLVLVAVAVAAYLVYRNWSTIGPMLSTLWATIKTGVIDFVNGVIGIVNHLPLVNISKVGGGSPVPGGAVRTAAQASGGRSPIYLDGKQVGYQLAPHVTARQVAGMNRPNGGTTGVDYTRAPTFVSAR